MGTKEFYERRGKRLGRRMIRASIGRQKAQDEIYRLAWVCFVIVIVLMGLIIFRADQICEARYQTDSPCMIGNKIAK